MGCAGRSTPAMILDGERGAAAAASAAPERAPAASPRRGSSALWPYGVAAVAAVALALAGTALRGTFPEVFLIIPMMATAIVAFRLGAGPAIGFGTAVGLAIWYWVLSPRGSFALANELQLADLIFYVLASLLVTIAIALLQREHRKLESARVEAARARDRLALAQEIARIGTFEEDLRSGACAWSPELESLHGLAPGTFEGTHGAWAAHVHPDDRASFERQLAQAAETGAFEGEWRIVLQDGSTRWVAGRGSAFRGEDGRPARVLGVNIDITERKHAEEALRRHEEALRESDRRKDEFLAVLSHELRNPLAPVRNALHLLEHAAPGSGEALRAGEVISRQIEHLARLVDDLLDVTRISRGKVRLQLSRVDLTDLVLRTVDDHQPLFAASGVALEVRADGGPCLVDADSTRIAQMLGNLLQNAAKFSERGGRVSVALEREGGRATIRVVDRGVGIAPEILARIFEPFTQADESLHRSRGGLGLGLALVKGFAALHGGTVEARSAGVGRGAELVVHLPLAPGEPEAVPAAAHAPEPAAPSGPRRVLLVEDNLDAAETLRLALEIAGHEVEIAHDGRAGVAMARAFAPDVVVCDIGLPEMDGYAVARTLRADPAFQATALVALTGYGLAADHRRALEAGFDVHLTKPTSIARIEEALATQAPRAAGAPPHPAARA
jgi:PAS domain S-box-containing protein